MKRICLVLLCLLGIPALTWAGPGWRLENDTEHLVYYVSVPQSVINDTSNYSSERLSVLVERYRSEFAYLPPRAVLPGFEPLSTAGGLLLLFQQGATLVPRVIALPAENKIKAGSDNFISFSLAKSFVDVLGFAMTLNAVDLTLPAGKMRIDGRFGEWIGVADALASRGAKALRVQRTDANGRKTIKPEQAMTASKGGTDLEFFKQDADLKEWYLMIATRSALAAGTSLVVRVYAPGAKESAIFFEIPVLESGGPVLLWKGDSEDPRHCGDFAHNGLFLEARIYRRDIPKELLDILQAKGSKIGIHLVYSDGSFAEDWYYGMVENMQTVFSKGL
jgi:hypothetical protein